MGASSGLLVAQPARVVLGLVSRHVRAFVLLLSTACVYPAAALGGSGPLGIDHEWSLDQRGIWSRGAQTSLEYGVLAVELGGALWMGNDDETGHVFWQAVDSTSISSAAAFALKIGLSRARPDQGGNANAWFKGKCCESFPSGEVTLQASFITPFIAHYAATNRWIWALEALPLYDSIARVKSQAHWQTDVLAGWALGSAVGYWSAMRSTPLSVKILPHGVTVGISKRF